MDPVPDEREELWQSFLETRVRLLDGDAVIEIVISDQVCEASPGHDGTVYLITSWNPLGRQLPPEENAARQREFEAQLASLQWCRAVGVAEDGAWIEVGSAITGVTRSAALDLARRWNQEAIYEWDPVGSVMAVVSCVDDRVVARRAVASGLGRRPCPMRPPGDRSQTPCGQPDDAGWRLRPEALGCDVCAGPAPADRRLIQ